MKQCDIVNDGKIDYLEFVQASVNHSDLLTKDNLLSLFDMIDIDKSGTISANEL